MPSPTLHLILASGSPRRIELLRQITPDFTVSPADIDEALIPGQNAAAETVRLATAKARASHTPGSLTLGVDTLGQLGDQVFGKPTDLVAARELLLRLSRNTHTVFTGWCIKSDLEERTGVAAAQVSFRQLSFFEIEEYCAVNPVTSWAGGYAIQSSAGEWVEEIVGSRDTVIGLPLAEISAELAKA